MGRLTLSSHETTGVGVPTPATILLFRHAFVALLLGSVLAIPFAMHGSAGEKKTNDVKKEAPILEAKGELKKDDKVKPYTVKFEAGKIYRIELKSDKFDAYLKLEEGGKTVAEDDDSAGDLNARIYYKAEKSGDHSIVVTSQNRQVGPFTLNVTLAADRTVASEYPNKTIDLKWTDGKAQYKGALDQNDANASGRYYKVFAVKLDQGKPYQLDHRSDDFDAYLILEDADGKRLAHNDDGGDKLNARLKFTPTKTAAYRIIATTLPTRQVGNFVLDIVAVDPKKIGMDHPRRELALTWFAPFVQVLPVKPPVGKWFLPF